MRGPTLTLIAAVVGTVTAVTALVVTVARLTAWLTPDLGYAPAATVAGVAVTACAVAWDRLPTEETDDL